ncbi:tetratricopeptide repeat protein [Candidatus Gracilibacteria bacterium]|nr:tetratricopeptide repeat protein [Candidatus Gracilibacteria bacterium]
MKVSNTTTDLLTQADKYKRKGDFQAAIDTLHKLIMHEPHCSEAYEELGDNYLSIRQMEKAEKALLQALLINPQSANAHYLVGFVYSLGQKWFKSVDHLCLADGIKPNHPEILRCLGWALYNQARKNQGLAILERSQTLSPNDQNILCDLGVCYMNNTEFDKAETTFKKVIELNPNSEQANECFKFLEMLKKCQLA